MVFYVWGKVKNPHVKHVALYNRPLKEAKFFSMTLFEPLIFFLILYVSHYLVFI